MLVAKGWAMEKWLCWASLGVAGIFLLVFLLDLVTHFLFQGIGLVVDILCIVCCALLAYLAWDALRDVK